VWQTLLGGLLAVVGGWGALYFQLRYAKKNKMDEIVAERKVTANAQAYSFTKQIRHLLKREGPKSSLNKILHHEEWFLNNRLFCRGNFPQNG
jgi:hypothetical protein